MPAHAGFPIVDRAPGGAHPERQGSLLHRLSFLKYDPTGNLTVLIRGPVPAGERALLAARLMRPEMLCAEQVGFIDPFARRLDMMGGEFCGNASMSFAAYLAAEEGIPAGAEKEYTLSVSGAAEEVHCLIRRLGPVRFRGTVEMPLPERVSGDTVIFPGIAHTRIPEDQLSPAEAEERIGTLCAANGVPAQGILLTRGDFMRPLVCVPASGTLVWEHGCGSGTCAFAVLEALRTGRSSAVTVHQPGGTLRAEAEYLQGRVTRLLLTGEVRLTAEGTVCVEEDLRPGEAGAAEE